MKHTPKGSITLTVYTVIGLISIDISKIRTIESVCAAILLLLCLKEVTPAEDEEPQSWRWSRATTRAVIATLILSVSSFVPFLSNWWKNPWSTASAHDVSVVVACMVFSFLVGIIVYLMLLLTPSSVRPTSTEALKLEHQACLALFQAACTCIVVAFFGALLSPLLNGEQAHQVTLGKLAWVFYCFGGGIIWFLRPCLARARAVRAELARCSTDRDETARELIRS